MDRSLFVWVWTALWFITAAWVLGETATPGAVTVDWGKTEFISKSTPTLQVVVNPALRRGTSQHDPTFAALRDLGADDVRFVPWLPYPRLAVAELEPLAKDKTSWDFSLIDPLTTDFLEATKGHPVVLNFSTMPAWLFTTPKPVTYPADPNERTWKYTQGTELRDPSVKELADYYARLVSWYTQGGFTDELGQYHASGYHYTLAYWEVFNEIDSEHKTTPQQYTERYDAVVEAIHRVSPQTKFVGLALTKPKPLYFRYFLDLKNHRPGIPLDMISYHFYAQPKDGETADNWQNTFFAEADQFMQSVRQTEDIRKQLSPSTGTMLDELGSWLPHDNKTVDDTEQRIPAIYWNASGALFAYLYMELSKLGIDVVGESQLLGYPTQYPSVSMIDWRTGKPNARFQILKLLKDNFGPGDVLVTTQSGSTDVAVQAYQTQKGRKILLINKRNSPCSLQLPAETTGATWGRVNESTGEDPPQSGSLPSVNPSVTLAPFEVMVIHFPK